MAYPRASWAAAARLSSAACLATQGRPLEAMQELQRVIVAAPASPEARQARTLNTIIHRLYVRPPARSPYGFSGRSIAGAAGRLKDVSAIAFGPDGSLFVTSRTGVLAVDQKGTTLRSISAAEPRALFVDYQGRVLAAQKALLIQEGAPVPVMQTLTVPRDGGQAKVLDDISAVAVLSSGERLVADRGQRGVFRFDTAGKYLGPFSAVRASRIALGPGEQVALLDRDNKSVAIVDRTGKALSRISSKAAGYELMNPTDVAFDVLGHLYVLDAAQVHVFAAGGALVATFAGGEKTAAGALREGTALALDDAGTNVHLRRAGRAGADLPMTRTGSDGERRMRGIARRGLLMVIAVCAMAAGGAVLRGAQAPGGWDVDLAEGQRLFDELDYEHAVPLLSRAIIALGPMAPQQPPARAALVSAYGMRARALFGLDDATKAEDDFRALLALDPVVCALRTDFAEGRGALRQGEDWRRGIARARGRSSRRTARGQRAAGQCLLRSRSSHRRESTPSRQPAWDTGPPRRR